MKKFLAKSKKKAKGVSNVTDLVPHISLCTSFSSSRTDFIDRARDWLSEQNPFVFTLRKVDSFPKSSTVFLTSDDGEEIAKISELSYGLESVLNSDIKINGHSNEFFPHLTLDSLGSPRRVKKAKSRFRSFFQEPILLPIVKVDVTEKIGGFRWETIETLLIGGGLVDNQITPDRYQFGSNGRASVVYVN